MIHGASSFVLKKRNKPISTLISSERAGRCLGNQFAVQRLARGPGDSHQVPLSPGHFSAQKERNVCTRTTPSGTLPEGNHAAFKRSTSLASISAPSILARY